MDRQAEVERQLVLVREEVDQAGAAMGSVEDPQAHVALICLVRAVRNLAQAVDELSMSVTNESAQRLENMVGQLQASLIEVRLHVGLPMVPGSDQV